jgi:hypothetical protein
MSPIDDYFEDGILLPDKIEKGLANYSYVCLLCKAKGLKTNLEYNTYKWYLSKSFFKVIKVFKFD